MGAFLSACITDSVGIAKAQDHLSRAAAGANTAILVTSGFLAASTAAAILIDQGIYTTATPTILVATVIRILSLIRGRIILFRYLGLETTRFWRRGFSLALTFYAILLPGLYLAPLSRAT